MLLLLFFLLLASSWASCLNWMTISEMKVLVRSSGFVGKCALHMGHLGGTLTVQCIEMQALQKLWPHGVVTGSEKTSRQMEQRNWSSDSRQDLATAMLTALENNRKRLFKYRIILSVIMISLSCLQKYEHWYLDKCVWCLKSYFSFVFMSFLKNIFIWLPITIPFWLKHFLIKQQQQKQRRKRHQAPMSPWSGFF